MAGQSSQGEPSRGYWWKHSPATAEPVLWRSQGPGWDDHREQLLWNGGLLNLWGELCVLWTALSFHGVKSPALTLTPAFQACLYFAFPVLMASPWLRRTLCPRPTVFCSTGPPSLHWKVSRAHNSACHSKRILICFNNCLSLATICLMRKKYTRFTLRKPQDTFRELIVGYIKSSRIRLLLS